MSGDENGNLSMLQRKSFMRNTSLAGHFGSINFVERPLWTKNLLPAEMTKLSEYGVWAKEAVDL